MTWKRLLRHPRTWLGLFLAYLTGLFVHAIHLHANGDVFATPIPVWGDWPIHFTMASAMAYRSIWLTSSPILIFAPFHYPFLSNLISALMIRLGVPFFASFWIPSLVCALGATILLFVLYRTIFKSETAALVGLAFFFFNGGIGFAWLIKAMAHSPTPLKLLFNPATLSSLAAPYPLIWESVIRTLFLPQRSFVLGFFIGLAAVFLLWTALNQEATHRTWRWWTGGILAGLLPVSHLHSFAAVGVIAAVWMAWDVRRYAQKGVWHRLLLWARFGFTSLTLIALQFIFLSIVDFGSSVARVVPGWYVHTFPKWILFWLANWGVTPFVAAWGFYRLWNRSPEEKERERLVALLLPFLILFGILNLVVLQPWIWDNTKILAWVSVAVSGLAGWAIVDLWGLHRGLALTLCVVGCLSGGLEAFRLVRPGTEVNQLYSHQDLELAEWVKGHTEANAIWLTGAHHNNWVFNLTGRQVLMTYEGWLWSHGYNFGEVKKDLETLMKDPTREDLLTKYSVAYAAVGPVEREQMGADPEKFKIAFDSIYNNGETQLFKRKHPTGLATESSANR